LFWIPWDHDLAMPSTGAGFGGGGGTASVDLFHTQINASWPLIRFLMDDPVYRATYRGHVQEVLATVFEPSRLSATLRIEHDRIAPFVTGAQGELAGRTFAGTPEQFAATISGATGLQAYVESRAAAVRAALGAAR
jgi:hypothetical protein